MRPTIRLNVSSQLCHHSKIMGICPSCNGTGRMEVQTENGADCPECFGRGESPDGVLKYWVWRIYHGKIPALIFVPLAFSVFFLMGWLRC